MIKELTKEVLTKEILTDEEEKQFFVQIHGTNGLTAGLVFDNELLVNSLRHVPNHTYMFLNVCLILVCIQ